MFAENRHDALIISFLRQLFLYGILEICKDLIYVEKRVLQKNQAQKDEAWLLKNIFLLFSAFQAQIMLLLFAKLNVIKDILNFFIWPN